MYIIYEGYDDNTAVVLDLGTYQREHLTEKQLISLASRYDVLGLSVSNNKINYITAYNCLSFPTEDEANDYIKYKKLTYQNKRYLLGYWWVFEKKDYKIHVDYYVCSYKGDDVTYVMDKGYTPYIQAAKSFDKRTAKEKAALMTKRSKTGTHWTTQSVVAKNSFF